MERRTFLRGGAAGGIVVLAGCLGGGDGSNGDGGTDGSGGDGGTGGTGSTDGTDGDNPGNETDGADGTETQNGDEVDGKMFGPFRVFDDELVEGESPGQVLIRGSVENTEPELEPPEDASERELPGSDSEREFPGLRIRVFGEDRTALSDGATDIETLEPGETKNFEVSIQANMSDIESYQFLLVGEPFAP